jgi:hypothetical protein
LDVRSDLELHHIMERNPGVSVNVDSVLAKQFDVVYKQDGCRESDFESYFPISGLYNLHLIVPSFNHPIR